MEQGLTEWRPFANLAAHFAKWQSSHDCRGGPCEYFEVHVNISLQGFVDHVSQFSRNFHTPFRSFAREFSSFVGTTDKVQPPYRSKEEAGAIACSMLLVPSCLEEFFNDPRLARSTRHCSAIGS